MSQTGKEAPGLDAGPAGAGGSPDPAHMDGFRPLIRGQRHMVASGHYLATQAAFQILEAGGNAVDAGVAGGIALGVVHSQYVNVAGVAPIVMYLANERRVEVISGLGGWPQAITPDYFQRRHGDTFRRACFAPWSPRLRTPGSPRSSAMAPCASPTSRPPRSASREKAS